MKEPIQVSLCPACGACPEVVVDVAKDEVRIGEDGNLVRLNKEAWNALVEKIKAGELIPLQ
ncbi:MAG: hypothetical protein COV75_01285 [Candidatus Omnitrophica bacterium CG11_big_fil_rev_8_21_14_0_20_63_9]|nr:MAG: hypothetical protein COV75_01285 [Candidatus Omnitrophica bacterium CG11_big_fil_rev_8_21_14_0_20_63_9]